MFSWKGLLLAPLVVPFVYAILLTISAPGRDALFAFLFFFIPGCVMSYGVTIFLFLPCLFVISQLRSLTATVVGLLGLTLGLVVYGPVEWVSYRASGVDSGPPEISFLEYLRREALGLDFWALVVAGLVTALLYLFLTNRSWRKDGGTSGD